MVNCTTLYQQRPYFRLIQRLLQHIATTFSVLLFLLPLSSWADVSASVDRRNISIQDTLLLTLKADKRSNASPQLGDLEKDFHILRNSKNSQFSIVNGQSKSTTEWSIELAPKRIGSLEIPGITLGQSQTQAIPITVTKAQAYNGNQQNQPVFIESDIDKNQAFVEEQIIYTVRIFQAIQLDNLNLTEPEIENAIVNTLEQRSFQRTINSNPYRVHEVKYAIFPQKSGELIIPEQIFSAQTRAARRSLFDLPGGGKTIRKQTQQHALSIKPQASEFTGQDWLPAASVNLSEDWSRDLDTLQVGDSVTRTIHLNVLGVTVAQLPNLTLATIDGAKVYPDQVQQTDLSDANTSAAELELSTAIIPTQTGNLVIPPLTITWWDTASNTEKTAELPGRNIRIQPSASLGTNQPTLPSTTKQEPTTQDTATNITVTSIPWWWALVTLIGYLGWLTAWWLWRQQRSQKMNAPFSGTENQSSNNTLSESAAFKKVQQACQSSNTDNIRQAIILWGQSRWPNEFVGNLANVAQKIEDNGIEDLLFTLNKDLFGHSATANIDGPHLYQTLSNWRVEKNNKIHKNHKVRAEMLYPI